MKFEKLNDNQIRCTLNQKDLSDRKLKLSELAYGSEKANALFHDMIAKASDECNFETENMPLMIEAIPVSPECLVLLITKVTDIDELDTRFSSFTQPSEGSEIDYPEDDFMPTADDVLNAYNRLMQDAWDADNPKTAQKDSKVFPDEKKPICPMSMIYSFDSLEEVITLARMISKKYYGENTLYKDSAEGKYYLVLKMSEHAPEDYNRICNIISDYGKFVMPEIGCLEYYEEHYDIIVKTKALQILAKM